MSNKILTSVTGDDITVKFQDQILDGNSAELREVLNSVLEGPYKSVQLDMEKVVIVSSLGISRLLSFKNKADEKNLKVKMSNLQDKLKDTLKKLMLDQFFGI